MQRSITRISCVSPWSSPEVQNCCHVQAQNRYLSPSTIAMCIRHLAALMQPCREQIAVLPAFSHRFCPSPRSWRIPEPELAAVHCRLPAVPLPALWLRYSCKPVAGTDVQNRYESQLHQATGFPSIARSQAAAPGHVPAPEKDF